MTDDNQPPKNGTPEAVPTEQLMFGLFAGPKGIRIQSPLPPRELLNVLVGIVEQVRERAFIEAAKADVFLKAAEKRIEVVPSFKTPVPR